MLAEVLLSFLAGAELVLMVMALDAYWQEIKPKKQSN